MWVIGVRGCSQIMSAAERGGRVWKMLTMADKGRRGVRQMMTMDDEGGGGVRQMLTLGDKGGGVCIIMKTLKKCLKNHFFL